MIGLESGKEKKYQNNSHMVGSVGSMLLPATAWASQWQPAL